MTLFNRPCYFNGVNRIFQAAALMLVLIMIWPLQGKAGNRTMEVPMTLDYDMLDSLAVRAAFTGAQKKAILLADENGCKRISVSDPCFHESDGSLFLDMRIRVRYGMSIGSYCLFPVSFDGYLVTQNEPVIDPETWQLGFTPLSSHLETLDRSPAGLADHIWQRVKSHLPGLMDGITIDLGLPRETLGRFLKTVLPDNRPDDVLSVIDSLRPGPIDIREKEIVFQQQMDIPHTLFREAPPSTPPVFTPDQQKAFINAWETWDAFLVHLITALSSRPLTPDEQDILLDVLLRLRYAFSEELDRLEPGTDDFVRTQFILAWERMSPVFRRHFTETGTDSLMGYLAFFSAADSLMTLDRLGPMLGLDISRQGLHQLASLVTQGKAPSLNYNFDMSPDLKNALGIKPARAGQTGGMPVLKHISRLYRFISGISTAQADVSANTLILARQWVFEPESPAAYLEQITGLIKKQTKGKLQDTRIPADRHAMFRKMILATAWQESCLRQFIEKKDTIIYLRSYNHTSVGIMQINERVWRGLYDQERLRWDIAYNARTGCDILELYLIRYAARWMKRHPDTAVDDNFLAGMLYAMYNGGPGHLEKFVKRCGEKGSSYLSDRLFREKWDWVNQGNLSQIGICLTGRPVPF